MTSPPRHDKPRLMLGMSLEDYVEHYWTMAELVPFAKRLRLSTGGPKPRLSERIRRRLEGLSDVLEPKRRAARGPRDSERPLTRETPVVHFKSDQRTRAFFRSQIGPEFHFTYHVNQFRIAHDNLTYGDLIDEWLAERDRRRNKGYRPVLAKHGEYNRYVRDFFADRRNSGKSLRDAAASWNATKDLPGERVYRPEESRSDDSE